MSERRPRSTFAYTPLATDDNVDSPRPSSFPHRHRKSFIFRALAAILLVVMSATLLVRNTGFGRMLCGGRRTFSSAKGRFGNHTLPSGDVIPGVALGVWQANRGQVVSAVKAALETGYRHIDGAWAYRNEAEVGQAIKESGVNRSDIFITSKLWNTFHRPADVEPALDDTLSQLDTSYIDLYLMHWPVAFVPDYDSPRKDPKKTKDGKFMVDPELSKDFVKTWRAMEKLVEKGKVKNIGVSNFNIRRLKELFEADVKIRPAVNQVELSFWNPQPELLKWAKENDLLLEAYSPLGSTGQVKNSLNVPEVKEIAEELQVTPAQVIISWLSQRGVIVLPKSVHADRIDENFHFAELPQAALDKLEKAATSHPPKRVVNPSRGWGIDDVFEGE